jgi:phosphoribosylanthranilate isomerase
MPTEVKICGLSDEEGVDAALHVGADFVGFVFFAKSPRNVALDRAAALAARARGRAGIVALTVDADASMLDELSERLRPDLLQLHGSESPERVAGIRARTGRPVMKALGLAVADDLDAVVDYKAADRFLLDAKPPKHATKPGGNASAFDWSILRDFSCDRPWLLAGGLNAENVGAALRATGAAGVDVSSGVETVPGHKDANLIRAFVQAVRAFDRPSRRLAG